MIRWDGASEEATFRKPMRTLARSAQTSADGSFVVIGTLTGEILILDPRSGEQTGAFIGPREEGHREMRSTTAHHGTVKGLHFSPDERRLYSISQGTTGERNQLLVWDVATRKQLRSVHTPGQRNESMDLSPDGKLLAIGTKQGTVELWEAE